MRGQIKEYILQELAKGHSLNTIRQHLIDYGHQEMVVDEAIKESRYEQAKEDFKHQETIKEVTESISEHVKTDFLSIGFITVFVLMIFITAAGAKVSLGAVILGFSPTLLTMIIAVTAKQTLPNKELAFLWITPLLTTALFAVAYIYNVIPSIIDMDLLNLSMFNIILSILYLSSFLLTKQKKIVRIESTSDIIGTLKDACRTLNMRIGMVYSSYHGGSDDMRNKLKIDSELYKKVSEISTELIKNEPDNVLMYARLVKETLQKLEHREIDIFPEQIAKLKNIIHDHQGNDQILVVLEANSDESVKKSYDVAIHACDNLIKKTKA